MKLNKIENKSILIHFGEIPPDVRTECLVQLNIGSYHTWAIATWIPEVSKYRFPYGKPKEEVNKEQINAWIDLTELTSTINNNVGEHFLDF